ncbi:MAG: FAD-dependent oxidoreductase [Chloroflexi bacterium]|nr:FAD-dependent oxidoreductase [Chloroflexota bacterium]
MSHVVVLGGGICGLAAGMQLAEHGQQVTVLEAQHFLGGLAATLRGKSGAGFDFGPHAYHARNERVLNMFKEIAHDGFPARPKNVRIKFRGRYYKYPLEAMDLARSMDPLLAVRAFVDYLGEVIRRKILPRTLVSAEDWVTRAMGRTLRPLLRAVHAEGVGHPAVAARGVVRAAPHPAHLAVEGHPDVAAHGPREDQRQRASLRAARRRALLSAARRGAHQ